MECRGKLNGKERIIFNYFWSEILKLKTLNDMLHKVYVHHKQEELPSSYKKMMWGEDEG